MLLPLLLLTTALSGTPYRDPAAMREALEALARAHPDLAHLRRYGESAEGRPLVYLSLGKGTLEELDRRPALLVLGAQRGQELLSATVCLETARAFLERPALRKRLHEATLYVIPHPNPDAVARRLAHTTRPGSATPTARPWDEDRDARADEDPPRDLDGDGVITWMRWRDPKGAWIIDPDAERRGERRLLRRADPARAERGVFRLAREGIDTDGDGRFAEDGPGGIDFARSFPLFYAPAHEQPSAGPYPAALPAARALLDWLLEHKNVAAAHLVRSGLEPDPFEWRPVALASGWAKPTPEEKTLFETLLAAVRERTGDPQRAAPFDTSQGPGLSGSLEDWLVHGLGVVAWSNRLWDRPPTPGPPPPSAKPKPAHESKAQDETTDANEPSKPAAATRTAPGANKPPPQTERTLAWLRWNDRALGDNGFVRWHAVSHPQLGEVEVGGWRPFTIETPPPELAGEIAAREVTVSALLIERLPRVELEPLRVVHLANGSYRVETALVNRGGLPSALAAGERNGYTHPPIVRLELPAGATLVFGRKRTRTRRLRPGERFELRWVIAAPRDGVLRVVAEAPRAGRTDAAALLEAAR